MGFFKAATFFLQTTQLPSTNLEVAYCTTQLWILMLDYGLWNPRTNLSKLTFSW